MMLVSYFQMVQHTHAHAHNCPLCLCVHRERHTQKEEGREEEAKETQKLLKSGETRLRAYRCTTLTDLLWAQLFSYHQTTYAFKSKNPSLLSFSSGPLCSQMQTQVFWTSETGGMNLKISDDQAVVKGHLCVPYKKLWCFEEVEVFILLVILC